ncbi:MAG: sporulation protein [Chloroflexi bacterium]|nr:sporulation protein [Chloroflexota bacterium]
MSFLGGAKVDWGVEVDGGRFEIAPGGTLSGNVRFTARDAFEARRVVASLVGTEEYAYDVTERSGRDQSRTHRRWETHELWRQDLELMGAAAIAAGETRALPFEVSLPAGAPPTFDSGVLRVRWRASASIDIGHGIDPSVDQPILVPLSAAELASVDPAALAERHQGAEEGKPYTMSVEPRPFIAGAPFAGTLDAGESLDLSRIRVEVKLVVSTEGSGGLGLGIALPTGVRIGHDARRGVTETRALWQGVLTEVPGADGTRRYGFSGQLPAEPVATIALPHGAATALVDVIVDRRMRRDGHFTRPVAIASR